MLGCSSLHSQAVSAPREHAGNDFFSGERGEGERTYKLLGGARHDDLHADAAVLQQADNFRRFVGRDAAGDAERDFHGCFDC